MGGDNRSAFNYESVIVDGSLIELDRQIALLLFCGLVATATLLTDRFPPKLEKYRARIKSQCLGLKISKITNIRSLS